MLVICLYILIVLYNFLLYSLIDSYNFASTVYHSIFLRF